MKHDVNLNTGFPKQKRHHYTITRLNIDTVYSVDPRHFMDSPFFLS